MANDSPAKSLVDIDLSSLRVSGGAGAPRGRRGGGRLSPALRPGRVRGTRLGETGERESGSGGRVGGSPRGRAGGARPWAAFLCLHALACAWKSRAQQLHAAGSPARWLAPERAGRAVAAVIGWQKCDPASVLSISRSPCPFSLQDPAGIFELVEVVGNGTYGQVYKVGGRISLLSVLLFCPDGSWVLRLADDEQRG